MKGVGSSGEVAVADPTRAASGQARAAAAPGSQTVCSAARFGDRPFGSVTTALRIAPW